MEIPSLFVQGTTQIISVFYPLEYCQRTTCAVYVFLDSSCILFMENFNLSQC
jgi:hypothetical protein